MLFDLSVLPSGVLSVVDTTADRGDDGAKASGSDSRYRKAFEESQAAKLFPLPTTKDIDFLSPFYAY